MQPAPDLSRRVHALLGLPFDAVDEAQAEAILRDAVATGRKCFMSTANVNFAMGCADDPDFRQSVLVSDLCTADGEPIVALARLLGAPVPHRVAGASLFERLAAGAGTPLRVFFFGGPDGVAELAARQLNETASGMTCVGFHSPGFGSLEEMSHPDVITAINATRPDFVVVSLGARKGQAWIQKNREVLGAPLISHLGAVVNFVAGTVKRAPVWAQKLKLEWLWRIAQEPALRHRYARDGMTLLKQLPSLVTLAWLLRRQARERPPAAGSRSEAHLVAANGVSLVTLRGDLRSHGLKRARVVLQNALEFGRPITLDLSEAEAVDTALAGTCLLIEGWCRANALPFCIVNAPPTIARILRLSGLRLWPLMAIHPRHNGSGPVARPASDSVEIAPKSDSTQGLAP